MACVAGPFGVLRLGGLGLVDAAQQALELRDLPCLKWKLNRVKSVFVRILPEITACPANAERSTSDEESFHEKFGKVKTHDCLD